MICQDRDRRERRSSGNGWTEFRFYIYIYRVVGGLVVSMSDCEVIVLGSIPGQPMFP